MSRKNTVYIVLYITLFMLALRRSCGGTPSNILTSLVTSSSSRRGWQSSLLVYQTDANKHHCHHNKRRSIHHYRFANKPSFLSTAIIQRLRGGGDNEHIMCANSTISTTSTAIPNQSQQSQPWRRAYLAVGSNLGDKYQNIAKALKLLESNNPTSIKLIRTSYLRSTSPMYVTDQPSFLNGAVEIETSLSPLELLSSIKRVESDLGRDLNSSAQRFGPRPVDLDILLFDGYEVSNDDGTAADTLDDNEVIPNSLVMNTERLEIPHPRMLEREFVLSPMKDLEEGKSDRDDKIIHPISNRTMSELLKSLLNQQLNSSATNDDAEEEAMRVLPLPRGRMLLFNETIIMGILNVTPDSFSDGRKYSNSSELAASQALQLVKDGAGIIDVGGESTRPGAEEVAIKEELERVIPVIRQIREEGSEVPISIDTRHATVARAAIEAGADIVNDVSGGTHDPEMLSCVASLGVPMIIMHMRGNPKTMQSLTNYSTDSISGSISDESEVVSVVARELMQRSAAAEAAGIPRWLQVVDPGIGFAKDLDGNLALMKGVVTLRRSCANLPFLYGPSRKGFIGKITGETDPEQRDYGTIAACLASIKQSSSDNGKNEDCNILRVHNVKAVKQAVQVYEAIMNAKR